MAEIEPGQSTPSVVRAGAGGTSAASNKASVTSYLKLRQSGTVDAEGRIVLSVGVVPSSVDWFIERLSIMCSSIVQTSFDVYEDLENYLYRLEHSPIGNDNIADYASPIWLPSYANLLVVWSDVSALGIDNNPTIAQITAQIRVVS